MTSIAKCRYDFVFMYACPVTFQSQKIDIAAELDNVKGALSESGKSIKMMSTIATATNFSTVVCMLCRRHRKFCQIRMYTL